jgi:orotate phosphoribosyltransferase
MVGQKVILTKTMNVDEWDIYLRKEILENVFVSASDKNKIVATNLDDLSWLMDFRKVLLKPDFLGKISDVLYKKIVEHVGNDFQVGGMEVAAIPIITSIVMKSIEKGRSVSGFFLRKSRKKSGLLNMFEGVINDSTIVLVDDVLNSGESLLKQVVALENIGKKVSYIIVIVQYRDISFYDEFTKRNITILSLFTLNDFENELQLNNLVDKSKIAPEFPYKQQWTFSSPDPHLGYVVPKSGMLLDDDVLYFGADNGIFWAIDAITGCVLWNYRILFGERGKYIFSTPVVFKDTVFFGAYDGNMYALNKKDGSIIWVSHDADWIGSSPCVSIQHNFVFIGMEYGFWKKKGGVTAYDVVTGKRKWDFFTKEYVHASPSYVESKGVVVCGSNGGIVYALNAKNGTLLWQYNTTGEIKAGCAISPSEKYLVFGTFGKKFIVLDIETGDQFCELITLESNYSTPVWVDDDIFIATSLDKNIYCYDVNLCKVVWVYKTSSRIFADPVVFNGLVYVGNNSASIYIIDVKDGALVGFFQTSERITNKVVIDSKNQLVFVQTFANEIIALSLESKNPIFSLSLGK